jgi:hypothetical protein
MLNTKRHLESDKNFPSMKYVRSEYTWPKQKQQFNVTNSLINSQLPLCFRIFLTKITKTYEIWKVLLYFAKQKILASFYVLGIFISIK